MLVYFKVRNFRSIAEEQVLSMEAADAAEVPEHPEQVVEIGGYRLLRTAVIYGANASGKSNVLKAFEAFVALVDSFNAKEHLAHSHDPFALDERFESTETQFSIRFILSGKVYDYLISYNADAISTEVLSVVEREAANHTIYSRSKEGQYKYGESIEMSDQLESKTRSDKPYLSVLAQFNFELARAIIRYFTSISCYLSFTPELEPEVLAVTMKRKSSENDHLKVFEYLSEMDFDLNDFRIQHKNISTEIESGLQALEKKTGNITSFDIDKFTELTSRINNMFSEGAYVQVGKNYYSNNGKVRQVYFDLNEKESLGTRKFFKLMFYLIAFSRRGGVSVIDELESHLHIILIKHLIRIIKRVSDDFGNFQFIFTTHSPGLLSADLFRRDQIYFTEKNDKQATELFSLYDVMDYDGKRVKADAPFEKEYLMGLYGGVPYFEDEEE